MTGGEIEYARIPGREASDQILQECAQLFAAHYGRWSVTHQDRTRAGKPITLSPEKLKCYLPGNDSWIGTARKYGELIGYALVAPLRHRGRIITWVTQLVVHKDYQNQRVGTTILSSIWGISDHYAWGIASANPYAIRALEKATRRRCQPMHILRSQTPLTRALRNIPYLSDKPVDLSRTRSVINTGFFQDISHVEEKIKNASMNIPWILGRISEGEEWFAATFHRQNKIKWTNDEFEQFMSMSSKIVLEAYERMSQARPQENHGWANPEHAKKEISFLVDTMKMPDGSSVVDFGCGAGRHSIALAKLGFEVVGIDFSTVSIHAAQQECATLGDNVRVRFIKDDCRTIKLHREFDFGICLYDVIGSFPEDEANMQILTNLAAHVKSGGFIAISVMSYDFMEQRAKYKYEKGNLQEMIFSLKTSEIMQKSGNICHPDYTLLDTKSRVAYRRERFGENDTLPTEIIVRDRRYKIDEIKQMCQKAGLHVELCGHVRAGKFEMVTQDTGTPTMEILAICRKSLI